MQIYTGRKELVEAGGRNVRQLINALDETYPGIKDALVMEDRLKPGVAVMIDGKIAQSGLLQPVSKEDEIVFVPAIGGG